jgi:hypothetical protein
MQKQRTTSQKQYVPSKFNNDANPRRTVPWVKTGNGRLSNDAGVVQAHDSSLISHLSSSPPATIRARFGLQPPFGTKTVLVRSRTAHVMTKLQRIVSFRRTLLT